MKPETIFPKKEDPLARIRNPKRRQLDILRPIENPPTDGIPNTTHSRCTSRDVTQIEDPRRKLPQLAQEKQTIYSDFIFNEL